ncbi:MAG: dihydroorotase [Bacteroidetes bacterium]|nr:MAG: dihydroorotase [Bacteroidota bacterium]
MNILLSSVQILDPDSPFYRQRTNVLIRDHRIVSIGNEHFESDQIVDCQAFSLSAGWLDMFCHIPEGSEWKDDLLSVSQAAAAGGFTEIAMLPNTQPVLQNKQAIEFVKSKSKFLLTQIHPIAAASLETEGKDMTEILDLRQAGAVAFSDGLNPLTSGRLLVSILQYLQHFDGLLINLAEEKSMTEYATMHEGIHSVSLGLKGMPSVAEKLAIIKILELLRYAGGRIHLSKISTSEGVELIRNAKKEGLQITCDIAAHQLAFTDADLADFDTNLKVKPPFRSQNDIESLIAGLQDSTIDCVVSAHEPHDEEGKKLEFDLAEFGIIGLETAFASLNTYAKLSVEQMVEKLALNPRKILGLEIPKIAVGELANLTLFDPLQTWTFTKKDIRSKSKNTPFVNHVFTGKVIGVFNQSQFQLFL